MGQVAALFDLDYTLLDTSSGQLYARFMARNGQMSRWQLARVVWWGLMTRLGLLRMENMIPKLLADAEGNDEAEMRRLCEIQPHIAERGLTCVDEHRAQGHVVALVSASTQYVVRPMANHLGIAGQYVCTHLESENGRFTGRASEPVCYGAGKVVWAQRFAAKYNVDLTASYFYTDSISDLPLLEQVGNPVAVNPDPRLRRLAQKRGWPIETFY